MRSLTISRRTFLASAPLLFAASAMPSHAEALSIMTASAAVINGCLKYQLKGGLLAYQHETLHVRLDQILHSQKTLLDRVSEVNESVQIVLHAASMPPETAEVATHFRDARRVYDALAVLMGALEKNSIDHSKREELAKLVRDAADVADSLKNGALAPSVPVEFALACERLKAVLFVLSFQNHIAGQRERALLLKASQSLEEAYAHLTRRRPMAASLPHLRSRLQAIVTLIDQHSLRRALPPDFSTIPNSSSIVEARRTRVCLKTGVAVKEIRKDRIWRDVPTANGKSLEQVGERVTIDETTKLAFPQFKLKAIRLKDGRYCYTILLDTPPLFQERRWTRRVVRTSMFGRTEEDIVSSDAADLIRPCMKLKVDDELVPREDFESLSALVAGYDALVALESRVLALQSICTKSKGEVSDLREKLKN